MTSERAQAYGRVMRVLEEKEGVKLLPAEVDRVRAAADALLFCEDPRAGGADEAVGDMEQLVSVLVESDRWTEESAQALLDDLLACGPARVAA